MKKETKHEIEVNVTFNFIRDIIDEALVRFNVDYNTVSSILKSLGYWELFENFEVTCVGAHDGIEPVLEKIQKRLKQ